MIWIKQNENQMKGEDMTCKELCKAEELLTEKYSSLITDEEYEKLEALMTKHYESLISDAEYKALEAKLKERRANA